MEKVVVGDDYRSDPRIEKEESDKTQSNGSNGEMSGEGKLARIRNDEETEGESENFEEKKLQKKVEPKLTPTEILIQQIQSQMKQLDHEESEESHDGSDETYDPSLIKTKHYESGSNIVSPLKPKSKLMGLFGTPPYKSSITGSTERVLTPGPQMPEFDDLSEHNPTQYLLTALSQKAKNVQEINEKAKSFGKVFAKKSKKKSGKEENKEEEEEEPDVLLGEESEDDMMLDKDLIQRFTSLKKARKKIHKEVKKLDNINMSLSKNGGVIHQQVSPRREMDQPRNNDSINSSTYRTQQSEVLNMERERIRDVAQSFDIYLNVMKDNLKLERKVMSQEREKSDLNNRLNKLSEDHLRIQCKYEKDVSQFLMERNRWLNVHNNVLMMLLLLFSFAIIFCLLFP